MGLFGALGGLLEQYAGGGAPPQDDINQHFDQVAGAVPASSLASGLAAALGCGGTGGFAQMASQLFASGAPGDHQAGLLNTLMASAGPEVLQEFAGNNPGSVLSGLLGGGQTQVTSDQAAQISPDEVQALAAHVHQNNPGIIGEVSALYSEHPTAIKALGAAALTMAVRHIAASHAASA
jgi:hypothetical protein